MFGQRKLRITIAALAATSGIALAGASAAEAAPNTGGYQHSSEAVKARLATCNDLEITYDNLSTLTSYDLERGDTKAVDKDLDAAGATRDHAKGLGCGWAQ